MELQTSLYELLKIYRPDYDTHEVDRGQGTRFAYRFDHYVVPITQFWKSDNTFFQLLVSFKKYLQKNNSKNLLTNWEENSDPLWWMLSPMISKDKDQLSDHQYK